MRIAARNPRGRRRGPSWLLRGLASRIGLCVLGSSVTVAAALTLLALDDLNALAAGAGAAGALAGLSRWAWTTSLGIVLATAGVSYALAAWRLKPLLDLAEGAR